MINIQNKKILLVYPPRDIAVRSIHEKIYQSLKELGIDLDFLSFEYLPPFENKNIKDRLINIYQRSFNKNNLYIYSAEKNFNNKYYNKTLNDFISNKKIKYDFTIIIKPEEFDIKFIHNLSKISGYLVGYLWDALRIHLKNDLLKCRPYYQKLYSFDKNNIKDHQDLKLSFITNFYFPDNEIIPFELREIDFFYIGSIAGVLPSQRRDWKLYNLSKLLKGNKELNIHVSNNFLETDKEMLTDSINYITTATTINQTLDKVRKSKVIIDICKSQHIGLSFRFFEAMLYQTKIITNNQDVVNYDFYNPNNIKIVNFDEITLTDSEIDKFLLEAYEPIPENIVKKYSLENWIKYVFM